MPYLFSTALISWEIEILYSLLYIRLDHILYIKHTPMCAHMWVLIKKCI